MALAYLILLEFIWGPGIPGGADLWGHLFRAEYLAGAIGSEGPGAYFTTAWMPQWYLGDPFRTYYPPLTVLLLTPLMALIGDSILALKVFLTLLTGGLAVLTYLAVLFLWGSWPACLGSILVLFAPYQLRTLLFEGNYPRYLALLALPVLLLAGERLLTTRGRRLPWVVCLAGAWAWAILAHPQQAYLFAIGFGLYLVARLFLDPDLPIQRGAYWLGGLLAGVLLSAPWTLPAYSRAELANVPYLPFEKVELFAADLTALLPQTMLVQGAIVVGSGTLLLALLAAASRPSPQRTSLLVASLVSIWFALGPDGVAFSLLPLREQLLPERFLNFASFCLPMSAAGILPLGRRLRWLRIAVILPLVALDAVPAVALARSKPLPAEVPALATAVDTAGLEESGRWILFVEPEPRSTEVYAVGSEATTVNGWGLENTPHHPSLRRYLTASAWSPEYLQSLLSRWSVAGAVVSSPNNTEAEEAFLIEAGFTRQASVAGYQLWQSRSQPGPVQALPADRMLLLGDRLSPFLMTFPFAEQSPESGLSKLSLEELRRYPAVGLYQFAGSNAALEEREGLIREYLQAGGLLVTDLTGIAGDYGSGLDYLGVDVLNLRFDGPMQVRWAERLGEMPTTLALPGETSWSGSFYRGLDQVFAEVQFEGDWYPILGRKRVGEGDAWFVGLNLLYYAQEAQLPIVAATIQDLTLAGTSVDRRLAFEGLPVSGWQVGGSGLRFEVQVPRDLDEALVSHTYSPRFRAWIDGELRPISAFENMMVIPLPAGRHSVEITYFPFGTFWPVLGWSLGFTGGVGLAFAYWWERRRFIPEWPGDQDRPVESDRTHAPCANCGFVLAEVGKPTSLTYPFQVVHCPICGLTMDDDGFVKGDELDEQQRRQRLADWLEQHNYHPETVEQRWGFDFESFFSGEGESPELPPQAGGG